MRLALEQMEPDKDMENFVRDYGTGDAIPDPPAFVNYNTTEAVPSGSSRPTSKPAQFSRTTQRNVLPRQPPPPPEEPFVNTAGVGANGKKGTGDSMGDIVPPSRSQNQSRASNRGQAQANGNQPANSSPPSSRQGTATSQHQPSQQGSFRPPNDPGADPIDPTAETMLKVGNSVYKVDPTNDPQQQQGGSRPVAASVQNGSIGAPEDPLLKTMVELNAASSEGNARRNSTYRHSPSDSRGQNVVARKNTTQGGTSLSPPSSSQNLANPPTSSRDYRNSAEFVVGSYPGSRPASPNPPTAALMQPPQNVASPPSGNQPVESVLSDYGRSLPGENKSISRSNSQQGAAMGMATVNANQGQAQNLARPVSRDGHPGIGAYGQHNGNQAISTSPAPQPGPNRRNSQISPAPSASGHVINRGGSITQHPTSVNSVGITLDPNGKVVNDTMADIYRQQQPQHNQPPAVQRNQNRFSNYGPSSNNQRPPYGGPPAVYQNPGQQPQGYVQPPAPASVQHMFNNPAAYPQPPPTHYPPPPPDPMYSQPQGGGYAAPGVNGAHVSRGPSLTGSYNSHLVSPPHPYGTGGRSPSPQPPQTSPTGQFTEDGRGVLFYGKYLNRDDQRSLTVTPNIVKALYDYGATIEEEFDFQAGDIIAVTATPEDGWWSGELLDEARRQRGRNVFPSNFVCLF